MTECPPDTDVWMARDSEVRQTLSDCISIADVIIVSVSKEDQYDFEHTRLYGIISQYIS